MHSYNRYKILFSMKLIIKWTFGRRKIRIFDQKIYVQVHVFNSNIMENFHQTTYVIFMLSNVLEMQTTANIIILCFHVGRYTQYTNTNACYMVEYIRNRKPTCLIIHIAKYCGSPALIFHFSNLFYYD